MLFLMIDLHTHSNASDGQYRPAELVEKACESGISAFALTDHDTIAGLSEAAAEAEKRHITFIRGIEIFVEWPTGEFHLLGLGFTHISPSLAELVDFLQTKRTERNLHIIEKMREEGIDASYDELCSLFPDSSIGRPHFAEYLKYKNIVKDNREAFEKYLGKGRPFYAERTGANLDEAIQAIVDSGGVPVIAHPLSLYVSWGHLRTIVEDIHSRGVEGLEAYHPGASGHDCKRLESLAREHGMFVTAGSDFHGEKIRADRKLGYTADGKKIDDRFYYEELLPYLAK